MTILVSLDGIAARAISTATMPRLTALARTGAACWSARTVSPSITLPAHTSLLRGVDPSVHGIFDNTPVEAQGNAPSILRVARDHGLRTAALYNWRQMHRTLEGSATERSAVDELVFFDSGYDPADDERTTRAALDLIAAQRADLIYMYLAAADLAGHDHGWMSEPYLEALAGLDTQVGHIVDAIDEDRTILITTDHGGLDQDHQQSRPEDMETFLVLRSPGFIAGSLLPETSILDVAPTLAELLDLPPSELWQGRSLVGSERPTIDVLTEMIGGMASHHYGENVDMLMHSLQTAAHAASESSSDELVVAALLHDLGHVLDERTLTDWGVPEHDAFGARFLQAVMPMAVTEPIRLHVEAKRHLVAVVDGYEANLSEASRQTLAQQGGRFRTAESREFAQRPWAAQAIALRQFDDAGKVEGTTVPDLDDYRDVIERMLDRVAAPISPIWARDACCCPECRDPRSGQHLVDIDDLTGWQVAGSTTETSGTLVVNLEHRDGRTHRCEIPTGPALSVGRGPASLTATVRAEGIVVLHNVPTVSGQVLKTAADFGFVRETNYGRLFDVRTEPQPNNLAYSSLGLPLHTDNPYRDPCPSVQLLHCLKPADEGGASRFSDGFAAADALRHRDPDAFALLSTTPLTFRFRDAEATPPVHLTTSRSMIELDAAGGIRAINLNHRSMEAPPLGLNVDAFYAAYSALRAECEAIAYEIRLAAGDLVAFDNRRMLHARTAFSSSSGRHLQGCYVDLA